MEYLGRKSGQTTVLFAAFENLLDFLVGLCEFVFAELDELLSVFQFGAHHVNVEFSTLHFLYNLLKL